MFSSPFPPDVGFVCLSGAPPADATLPAEEMALLSPGAVEKRRRHFVQGRRAARQALEALGVRNAPPISKGERGEPAWPDGIVGTITHTGDIAAAAVARRELSDGIGLDIERVRENRRVDISRQIADAEEQAWIDAAPAPAREGRIISLFAAKECVYKALYAHHGDFFGFSAVTLRWDEATGAFEGPLRIDISEHYRAGHVLRVDCVRQAELVMCALLLPPR